MGAGDVLLRAALLRQRVLQLPVVPAEHRHGAGADRVAAHRPPHGVHAAGASRPRASHRLVLLPQPGPLQPQGALPHHYLRRRRLLRRLRPQHRRHRQGVLPAADQPVRRHAAGADHPAAWVRVGWPLQEVPRRFRLHVVAHQPCPGHALESHARGGEASQGRCDASPVLRHRRHLQLRLLPHPELPVPVAEHRVGAVLAVQGLGDGAADRVGPAGPRHRLLRPGLEHGGRLPRQPAGVAGVHRRQRHGRVRAHHLRRAAAALLDGHLQRQALPAHLAARLRRRRKALRHWPRPQPRHLHAQPRRLRRLQPHQRQRALRCQLRHRLRQPHVHALARRALPRKGGLGRPLPEAAAPEDRCRRRAHEDHEAELQARAAVVVPPHARRRARALALHLRGLRPAAAAPLLGPPPCLRHRLRLHPPRRCHLRHHQHAAGAQHRHRAHHRLPLPGEAAGQRGVQDVRLHQHGPGAGVPGRLEAGPLHEDTPEVHVLRAARRNAHGVHGALRHRVVAAHHGQGHLRRGQAPRRQPLDVPRRRRLLQRLHHLGRRRPAADVRQPR
uniref:Uncharacterized protein n=1 Tax=Zea mays TaxID=4577 RepID=A0A804NW05_MAIZE